MAGCDRTWAFDNEILFTAITALKYKWKTEWILVADGASISACLRAASVGANFQFYLVYETAEVRPEAPSGSPTAVGTAVAAATTGTGRTGTVSAPTAMWVRFGYGYQLTAGTTEASAEVGMEITIHQCVTAIARVTASIPPTLAAGTGVADSWIVLLGDLRPTAGNPKYKAAIVARDISNVTDCRTELITRTADDRANPSAWGSGEAAWDTPAAPNDERCTAEIQPSVSGKGLLQVAFAVRRASGAGGSLQGDFEILLVEIK